MDEGSGWILEMIGEQLNGWISPSTKPGPSRGPFIFGGVSSLAVQRISPGGGDGLMEPILAFGKDHLGF